MTDRELLVLAAKAAGFKRWNFNSWPDYLNVFYADDDIEEEWNPLYDDADALRLAVKLCMNIEVTDSFVFACSIGSFSEPATPNREAAVRRAIVRAAAAMASNGETV